MLEEVLNNFNKSINGEEPERVPIVVWTTGPSLSRLEGVKEIDYYLKPALKLKTQLSFQDNFPEIISLPGESFPCQAGLTVCSRKYDVLQG